MTFYYTHNAFYRNITVCPQRCLMTLQISVWELQCLNLSNWPLPNSFEWVGMCHRHVKVMCNVGNDITQSHAIIIVAICTAAVQQCTESNVKPVFITSHELQKQIGCFNYRVVTLVAYKLERQQLWEVYTNCIGQPERQHAQFIL